MDGGGFRFASLFRLSLEALFYWTLIDLEDRPKGIDELVCRFLAHVPRSTNITTAGAWIRSLIVPVAAPTELIARIDCALRAPYLVDLAPSIATALAFCLAEASQQKSDCERMDRLPLRQARQEATVRGDGPIHEFVRHIFESWVLAQHAYWSVGRGLADARAQGKTLLRLKIILDEGGWTVTPGAPRGEPPSPTPDRLRSAISLAEECGLFRRLQSRA